MSSFNSSHIITVGLYHQLLFTIIFAVFPEFRWDHVVQILLIGTLCTIAVILFTLRLIFVVDKKSKLMRIRIHYTIGCVGMLLLAIIPIVVICFWELSMINNIRIYFISNITSIALYYTFIYNLITSCELKYKTSHFPIAVAIYFIIFVPCLVWKCLSDLEYGWVLVWMGGTYSTGVLCQMVTLMSIASGQLELVEEEDLRIEEGVVAQPSAPELMDEVECSVIDEEQIQKRTIHLECEVCMEKYDDSIENRIPRILTKCGHTMCHGCIKRILDDKYHLIIFCPFCQQVTNVDAGNVQNLPKNFAILQLI